MAFSKTILVVDDDADICDMIRTELTSQGCHVTCVSDREEALRHIQTLGAPDIILLDYNMPGMDARTFMDTLLEMSIRPPRVILMTAAGEAHQRARGIGVPEVLSKPFDPATLFAHVEPCIP
jgi:two-component system OmpR family response regulator